MDHVDYEEPLPRQTVDDFEFEDRHKPLDLFGRGRDLPDEEFRDRVASFDNNYHNHNSMGRLGRANQGMAHFNHQNPTLSEIKDEVMEAVDDTFRLGHHH